MEPMVLAGERFRQPRAGVTASTLKDSLELQDDELGPEGDAGSRFKERLKGFNQALITKEDKRKTMLFLCNLIFSSAIDNNLPL